MEKEKIAVFCVEGAVNYKPHARQMISKAYWLAKEKEAEVVFCYIGKEDKEFFHEIGQCGADKIEFYQSESELTVRTRIMCEWGEDLLKTYQFLIVLFMAEECGQRVAAVLSTRLQSGLTADCIDVSYQSNDTIFSRTALNDAVVANIKCTNEKLQLATIHEGVFQEDLTKPDHALVHLWEEKMKLEKDNIELLERKEKAPVENVDLSKAKIIFGIGRGAMENSILTRIKELAKKCNAELVGTRPVVENGILPKSRQVGQSGRTIAPDLYVAFGISGVSQHIVGIKKSKLIIAINKDKDAPLFQFADYALVGDIRSIIDQLDEDFI